MGESFLVSTEHGGTCFYCVRKMCKILHLKTKGKGRVMKVHCKCQSRVCSPCSSTDCLQVGTAKQLGSSSQFPRDSKNRVDEDPEWSSRRQRHSKPHITSSPKTKRENNGAGTNHTIGQTDQTGMVEASPSAVLWRGGGSLGLEL